MKEKDIIVPKVNELKAPTIDIIVVNDAFRVKTVYCSENAKVLIVDFDNTSERERAIMQADLDEKVKERKLHCIYD